MSDPLLWYPCALCGDLLDKSGIEFPAPLEFESRLLCRPCFEDRMIQLVDPKTHKKLHRGKFGDSFRYLVTFTRNPNSRFSLEQWLVRIRKECMKSFIIKAACALEHPESNIHVHVCMETSKAISNKSQTSPFKVFSRDYGFVDVRRIVVDNGVEDYISKEYGSSVSPQHLELPS